MSQKRKKDKAQIIQEARRKNVRDIIIKAVIVAILLIMTTYAWFTTQKDITLSNLRGTVEVVENMEISLDAKTWHHRIDLSETEDGKTTLQLAVESRNAAYNGSAATAPNIEPRELLPASTLGGVGNTYMPLYKGTATAKEKTRLREIFECDEIDDSNLGIDNGYFAFDIYIRNTSRDGEPDILQLNLNSSLQVLTEDVEKEVVENGVTTTRVYKGRADSGIQNTMRVALALYEDTVRSMSEQKEVLDATRMSNISKVTIWEPNAPHHVQYIVDNNNKLTGSGAKKFEEGDALTTYALKSSAVGKSVEDVYNTDDVSLGAQQTLQTAMTDTTEGSEDYRILAADKRPIDLVDIDGNKFMITSNTISRLRVYVWMEGQDIDCINHASNGGGIELDLGLTKDNAVGAVLEEDDTGTDTGRTNTVATNTATGN